MACGAEDIGKAVKQSLTDVGLMLACDPAAMGEDGCWSSSLDNSSDDTTLASTWTLMCEQMGWVAQPVDGSSTSCIPPESSGLLPELSGCSDPAAMCTEEQPTSSEVEVELVPTWNGGQPDPIDDSWTTGDPWRP